MAEIKKFHVKTWGCQMNELDSQRMAGHFVHNGWIPSEEEDADLIILNTCSVREKAEEKFFGYLGRLKKWKSIDPERKIIVAGCVAQQYGSKLFKRMSYIDLVLGPAQIDYIMDHLHASAHMDATRLSKEITYDYQTIHRSGRHTAMVTVIEGCDRFCSFCIVPFTRGRERSRPLTSILKEVEQLAGEGVTDILLLGQTVNGYNCPASNASFAHLLSRVAAVSGLKCLRFVTSHPSLFSDDLIELIADNPVFSRYMHLPVQSGSDSILKRMNRQYTRDYYFTLIDKIRSSIPGVALSSDIIVGFPGEDNDDHNATLDLLRRVHFDSLFFFKYSPRGGTLAARWEDDVPTEVKNARLQEVIAIQAPIEKAANESLVGTTLKVLLDGTTRKDSQRIAGRSHCNRVVNLIDNVDSLEAGTWVDVEITRAHAHSLTGKMVSY